MLSRRRVDEVFISYSRVDSSFVQTLDRGLREADKDVWVDWEGIPPSADWMAEIGAAIEGASAFVFVLTEASARSEICARELELAVADNKRIVPVVPGAMDPSKAPHELARLNWIAFDLAAAQGEAFANSMAKLVSAIDTDLEWVAAHTHWLTRAHNWERRDRDHSLLLRGNDLRQAEDFLASQREGVEPQPTELQREFVLESRRAAGRRQRVTLGAVGAGMIVAIVLAIFAFIQRNEANDQKRQAQSQALSARAEAVAPANPILSAQLAREAVGTAATPDAVSSLRAAVTRLGYAHRLVGHHDHINDVAYSPDSALIATAGSDSTVRVWDAATGAQLSAIELDGGANHAAFSPDGSELVIAGVGGLAAIYDADTGELVREFDAGKELVLTAEFSPDGASVITGGVDGSARLFDAASGEALAILQLGRAVYAARFSPDGKRAVVAGEQPAAAIWTLTSADVVELNGHPGKLYNASWSPDGKWIVTAAVDGSVRIWSADSARQVRRFAGNRGGAYSAEFSPSGDLVVSVGFDRDARIWEVASGREVRTLVGHSDVVADASFSPDGEQIATAGDDHLGLLWDATESDAVELTGAGQPLRSAAFSPDGERVVTGGDDGIVRSYPAAGGDPSTFEPARAAINTLDVDAAGDLLVASNATPAALFGPEGDRGVALDGSEALVRAAAVSAGGDTIATAGYGRRAAVWDGGSGEQAHALSGATRPVYTVAVSADGSTVATGGADRAVRLWDPETGELTGELNGHTGAIDGLAFSPDGERLASASDDGTVRIWDVDTRAQLGALRGHDGLVSSVSFSRDGERLVTSGADATVRIWDAATATEIESIPQPASVLAARFSPADQHFVVADQGGGARVYDCGLACAETEELLDAADELAGPLSDDDRAQALGG